MRVVTWNVNSLPARLERVLAFLDDHRPDVVLLQETKVGPETFPHLAFEAAGYSAVDHSGGRWEGVAVAARHGLGLGDPVRGLVGEPETSQARWLEVTVDGVTFVSVYVPNGRVVGSETFWTKLAFLEAMANRAAALGERAVIGGDMNVCPSDLDVWDPAEVHGSTHITDDERRRLAAVVDAGFVDAFRKLHPEDPGFSWWDYRAGHFHKGFGLRIDLLLVGAALADGLTRAEVIRDYRKPSAVPGTKPSDHAPVLVEFG
ncbi:MAG: exodeoxyribonuclease III [Acidimicrobiia bacterium]